MKHKHFATIFILTIFTLLSGCAMSKEISTDTIAPIMNNNQCGYVDENGEIVIDLKFKGYVTIGGKNRAGSFQIFSSGPNGEPEDGKNEDQGDTSTDKSYDDIATWHK